jgi:hypothetical protein
MKISARGPTENVELEKSYYTLNCSYKKTGSAMG